MEWFNEFITGTAGRWILGIAGFSGFGMALDYLMKKFVTQGRLNAIHDFFAYWIAAPGDWLGLALNSAGTKLPLVGKMWNKTLEPWVIIFIETLFGGILDGFKGLVDNIIKALQSDNPSTK